MANTDLKTGLKSKYIKAIYTFILGMLSFFLSQIVLRLPLLRVLQQSTDFMLASALWPLLIGVLVAFSAGLFEESARYLCKRFLLRPWPCRVVEPLLFGLGHGCMEAFYLFGPLLLYYPLSALYMGLVERLLAIILHVGFTFVVWNGFQKGQALLYLLLAILLHGAVDSMIPLFAQWGFSLWLLEAVLALAAFLMIFYVLRSKKLYQ